MVWSIASRLSNLLIFFILVAGTTSTYYNTDPCSVQRRCSTHESIVWALNGNQCVLFRNHCMYLNDYCARRAQGHRTLTTCTRERCKRCCTNYCPTNHSPVCTEHNGMHYTFSNSCNMVKSSCHLEKSYMYVQNGACSKPVYYYVYKVVH